MVMSINAAQIRAARALLNWSQEELAERSGIARATIKNIENELTIPRADTVDAIRVTFEENSVEFLPGSGTRIRDDIVTVIQGGGAARRLLDDIYRVLAHREGEEVLLSGLNEKDAIATVGQEFLDQHLKRLLGQGIKERILLEEGDSNFVHPLISYRWLPKENFTPATFYVYGEKLALVKWAPQEKVVIIDNPELSRGYRGLFDFAWSKASAPAKRREEEGHRLSAISEINGRNS